MIDTQSKMRATPTNQWMYQDYLFANDINKA